MPRNAYLDEAAYIAAAVPQNRCPSTDALDVLDANPHIQLALEDTWTGPGGRVYRQVPADRISRWSGHIARTFKSFLRIGREPAQVFVLLDLLHKLDAGTELVRSTLVACRRRGSLNSAIEYFEKLVDELESVTYRRSPMEITIGTYEPRRTPRVEDGEVTAGQWNLPRAIDTPDDDDSEPPYFRVQLLHDPNASDDSELDWMQRQPKGYRALYYSIKRAKAMALPAWRARLLDLPDGSWSHVQMTVLWETYQMRRDCFRKRAEQRAKTSMRSTSRKLLRRISKIGTKPELGHVGKCLFEAMKGQITLPGPVSQPEWAVVFQAYRERKSELFTTSR